MSFESLAINSPSILWDTPFSRSLKKWIRKQWRVFFSCPKTMCFLTRYDSTKRLKETVGPELRLFPVVFWAFFDVKNHKIKPHRPGIMHQRRFPRQLHARSRIMQNSSWRIRPLAGGLERWFSIDVSEVTGVFKGLLGGGFKDFSFAPRKIGEDSQFHKYCSKGLKPPTSLNFDTPPKFNNWVCCTP